MAVDLAAMSIFVAVAEAGSFTAAADRLGMAKSAVSQRLTELERELGVRLLQRTTRRVAITDAGTIFLADCRELLSQAERVLERARSSRARPSGTLRLTSTEDMASPVAAWIVEYRRRFPEVRIDYQPTDRRVDLVAEGFDLALRMGGMPDSSLRAAPLGEFDSWLVASPSYLAAHGEPSQPSDLAHHEWIALSVIASPWVRQFEGPDGDRQTIRMRGSVSVSTAAACQALVRAGLGIAVFPDSMARADVADGRLRRLLASYRLPRLHLYAAYPDTPALPAKTRAFIDLARDTGWRPERTDHQLDAGVAN